MSGIWGNAARRHWQRHRPEAYAALEDPDRFFAGIEEHASAYFLAIRDGMLDGINPNNGTIGWTEFLDRVAWANQTAREIVEHELIYLPSEDDQDEEEL